MHLFEQLKLQPEYVEGLVHCITSDILDHSEFWTEDSDEFLELFEEAVKSKAGREFILFLVGVPNLNEYLNTLSDEIFLDNSEKEDD